MGSVIQLPKRAEVVKNLSFIKILVFVIALTNCFHFTECKQKCACCRLACNTANDRNEHFKRGENNSENRDNRARYASLKVT